MAVGGHFETIWLWAGYILAWELPQVHIECHRRGIDEHLSVFVPVSCSRDFPAFSDAGPGVVHLATRRCVFAVCCIFSLVWGSHTGPHAPVWDVPKCCRQSLSPWGVLFLCFFSESPRYGWHFRLFCLCGHSNTDKQRYQPQVSSAGHSFQDLSM